jgi:hypothetical protein
MIKEFVLKFVAALAGVEHNLVRPDDHGNQRCDTMGRLDVAPNSAMPYRVVTMQRIPVTSRYSRMGFGVTQNHISRPSL